MNFIANQFDQIVAGGAPVILKKAGKLIFLCASTLFLPVILIVRLIRPAVLIRFGPLRSNRIGHFALNTEIYLCERDGQTGGKKSIDLFYHMKPVCNEQLKVMWERVLFVSPIIEFLYTANRFIPGYEAHETHVLKKSIDQGNLMATIKPHLKFTDDEARRGERELRLLGIPQGAPFICFSNRDQAYLNAVQPDTDWSYHEVRNSRIGNYLPAVEALTGKGYYAVRMGSMAKEPAVTDNPKVIDYATKGRNDFMDVYLCAKASMYLGDTAGIHTVSKIWRVPIVYVNVARFSKVELMYLSFNALFIPKKIWSEKESRLLTVPEMLQAAEVPILSFGDYCTDNRLMVIENSPEEIYELAMEWEQRKRGIFRETDEDNRLQGLFWKTCQMEHIYERKNARIGTKFLKDNAALIEQEKNEISSHI